jgi:hypothetical protein
MKSKKGAIELSMTTIIVIVIGITLLTLGITWVKNSMGDVMDLTEEAFAMSDQELENMFSDSTDLLKIVPGTVEMNTKDSTTVGVIFYNLESIPLTFTATVTPISMGTDLECKFVDTLSATSDTFELNSGSSAIMKLRVATTPTTILGPGGCKVAITSLTTEDTSYQRSKTLAVEIEP